MVVRGFSLPFVPIFFLLQPLRSSFGTLQMHWPVVEEMNVNEKIEISDEMR